MSNADLIEKVKESASDPDFINSPFEVKRLLLETITALEHADRMREALQEFVNRCDRGEVSSRYTYSKFKFLLEKDNEYSN